MLRFLPVVMLIPFPILNSLNDCLKFGAHYRFYGGITGLILGNLFKIQFSEISGYINQ